jgi:hypothetical protein
LEPFILEIFALCLNFLDGARHWWLMPIILVTQEAEIRGIAVQRQHGKVVPRDPISKNPLQK